MDKLIKYLAIIIFTIFLIYITPIVFFGFLYSYGAGGTGKIEGYEFKTEPAKLRKELKMICDKSKYLSYKDTLESKSNNGFEEILITIRVVKDSKEIAYESKLNGFSDEKNGILLLLIYINDKSNDDFGWFSSEKYNKIKLFEKEIIEPLAKKYKYEKLE
ncbi:hypothetical protein [Flavobacterium sp. N1736]|uniref:hypothetical protein n=1 Tax=Flavobacterium sp. N1736 TaxID=2986823 RepID=UPI002224EFEE|nr:hypothetical protein [Flavobacterium sp. N1736]